MGSGSDYLSGWALVFTPFEKGKFLLNNNSDTIDKKGYGKIIFGGIPTTTVEVPVFVNDNGKEYNTILYTGAIVSSYDKKNNQIKPSYDWCLIDITKYDHHV